MNEEAEDSLGEEWNREAYDVFAAGGNDPAGNASMTTRERLDQNEHALNMTVALLILVIFSFFFVIILVILCFNWMERKRVGFQSGCVLLPSGPLPGYVTILSSDHPHMRLLGHYQFQPFQTKEKWTQGGMLHDHSPTQMSPTNSVLAKDMRKCY